MVVHKPENPDEVFAALLVELLQALGGASAGDIRIAQEGAAPAAMQRPAERRADSAFSDIGAAVQSQTSILDSLGINTPPSTPGNIQPKPHHDHIVPKDLKGFTDNNVTPEMVAFARKALNHGGDSIGTRYDGGVLTAKNGQKYEVVAVREIHTDDHTTGNNGKVIDHPGITLYFKKSADKASTGNALA